MVTTKSLESRLSEAIIPIPELEPELEDWILNFFDDEISASFE